LRFPYQVKSLLAAQKNFDYLQQVLTGKYSDGVGFSLFGVGIRFGAGTVTWAGGTNFSGALNVPHGLGRTPSAAFLQVRSQFVVMRVITEDATNIQVQGAISMMSQPAGVNPAAASTCTFYWLVIG
jgi:hypothetical protein